MSIMPPPQPGWYPDPATGGRQRYWDGKTWGPVAPTPPMAPAPARKSSKWWIILLPFFLCGGCGVFGLIGSLSHDHSSSSSSSSSSSTQAASPTPSLPPGPPPTAYSHDGDCNADITPKLDGICRVSDGGFFSTGLEAGWIESAGPRNPASYPNCMWERLSGPDAGDINMIIDSDMMDGSKGVTRAHIEKTDYAFWSKGCLPWERLT
jgi:hypothetical protein